MINLRCVKCNGVLVEQRPVPDLDPKAPPFLWCNNCKCVIPRAGSPFENLSRERQRVVYERALGFLMADRSLSEAALVAWLNDDKQWEQKS